jgi:outer membrane lipoprotein carrier protein
MRIAFLSLAAGLIFTAPAMAQTDVKALAHAVDEHYDHLKTLKASFAEIYQGPGISRTESGTLWLKKPGKMRWEYSQPRPKLFLTDSQNAFFYVPGERQARKAPIRKLDDLRSPLRYLLGKLKLDKELEGLSRAPDVTPLNQGDTVLRGVPKGLKDRLSDVVLEITPEHQISRILIHELDGSSTDFRFTQLQEGIPVQDNLFRFTPPPGTETILDEHVTQ